MELSKVIQDVASFFKKKPPTPDTKGRFSIAFDKNLKVEFFEKSQSKDSFYIFGVIDEALKDTKEGTDLLKLVLQWNFARLKDQKETLSWDSDRERLVLFKEVAYDQLSETPITKHLEDFLNHLTFWNKVIKEGPNTTSTSPFSSRFQ